MTKQHSNLGVRERAWLTAALSIFLLSGCELFATENNGSGSPDETSQNTDTKDPTVTSTSSGSGTGGGGGGGGGSGGNPTQSATSSNTRSNTGSGTGSKTQSTTSSVTKTNTSTGTGTGTGSKTNTSSATASKTVTSGTTITQCQTVTFATKAATGTTKVTPISGGTQGEASRYWDCCKPTCSWKQNVSTSSPAPSCSQSNQVMSDASTQSACAGGSAFACYSFVPWDVSPTLSYGWAAVQANDGAAAGKCGHCYQLDFTGESTNPGDWATGCEALKGKSMIVQIMNTGADVKANQFDLLIPGGGVGLYNACTQQWGTSSLGAQYGGFLADLSNNGCGRCTYVTDVEQKGGVQACILRQCRNAFGNKPDLVAGCEWFVRWFNAANNPKVVYKEVTCPTELTDRSKMKL